MRRVLFLAGWLLVIFGFFAGIAAIIAQTLDERDLFFGALTMAASDTWYTLWPNSYLGLRIRTGNLSLDLLAVLDAVLLAPGWLVLAGPGFLLSWLMRPSHPNIPKEDDDFAEHAASLFLFDELAHEARRQSKEDGEHPDVDDRLPDQAPHGYLREEDGVTNAGSVEDYDLPFGPPDKG